MRRLVVFTKISCVCPDLVDLGGVDQWGALELEHEDGIAGQKHNVRAPSPLEWELGASKTTFHDPTSSVPRDVDKNGVLSHAMHPAGSCSVDSAVRATK